MTKAKAARDARTSEHGDMKSKLVEGMSAAAIAAMENSLKNFREDKIDGETSAKSFEHTHSGN